MPGLSTPDLDLDAAVYVHGQETETRDIVIHLSTLQGAKQLLLRGLDGAQGEWLLLAACHNLRKLHGHIGVAGLAAT